MNKSYTLVFAMLIAGLTPPAATAAAPDPATVVKMCDTNNDDAVTEKEWQACGAPTAYPADADKNHDGKVSVDEMEGGTASTNPQPPAKPN